jgi:hypothetical protein
MPNPLGPGLPFETPEDVFVLDLSAVVNTRSRAGRLIRAGIDPAIPITAREIPIAIRAQAKLDQIRALQAERLALTRPSFTAGSAARVALDELIASSSLRLAATDAARNAADLAEAAEADRLFAEGLASLDQLSGGGTANPLRGQYDPLAFPVSEARPFEQFLPGIRRLEPFPPRPPYLPDAYLLPMGGPRPPRIFRDRELELREFFGPPTPRRIVRDAELDLLAAEGRLPVDFPPFPPLPPSGATANPLRQPVVVDIGPTIFNRTGRPTPNVELFTSGPVAPRVRNALPLVDLRDPFDAPRPSGVVRGFQDVPIADYVESGAISFDNAARVISDQIRQYAAASAEARAARQVIRGQAYGSVRYPLPGDPLRPVLRPRADNPIDPRASFYESVVLGIGPNNPSAPLTGFVRRGGSSIPGIRLRGGSGANEPKYLDEIEDYLRRRGVDSVDLAPLARDPNVRAFVLRRITALAPAGALPATIPTAFTLVPPAASPVAGLDVLQAVRESHAATTAAIQAGFPGARLIRYERVPGGPLRDFVHWQVGATHYVAITGLETPADFAAVAFNGPGHIVSTSVAVRSYVASLPPGEPVVIFGHSAGGNAAQLAGADLAAAGRALSTRVVTFGSPAILDASQRSLLAQTSNTNYLITGDVLGRVSFPWKFRPPTVILPNVHDLPPFTRNHFVGSYRTALGGGGGNPLTPTAAGMVPVPGTSLGAAISPLLYVDATQGFSAAQRFLGGARFAYGGAFSNPIIAAEAAVNPFPLMTTPAFRAGTVTGLVLRGVRTGLAIGTPISLAIEGAVIGERIISGLNAIASQAPLALPTDSSEILRARMWAAQQRRSAALIEIQTNPGVAGIISQTGRAEAVLRDANFDIEYYSRLIPVVEAREAEFRGRLESVGTTAAALALGGIGLASAVAENAGAVLDVLSGSAQARRDYEIARAATSDFGQTVNPLIDPNTGQPELSLPAAVEPSLPSGNPLERSVTAVRRPSRRGRGVVGRRVDYRRPGPTFPLSPRNPLARFP